MKNKDKNSHEIGRKNRGIWVKIQNDFEKFTLNCEKDCTPLHDKADKMGKSGGLKARRFISLPFKTGAAPASPDKSFRQET